MKRIVSNVISLAIFVGVIIGVTLGLRGLGVNHLAAWLLGIGGGAVVMSFLQAFGLYSRSWRGKTSRTGGRHS